MLHASPRTSSDLAEGSVWPLLPYADRFVTPEGEEGRLHSGSWPRSWGLEFWWPRIFAVWWIELTLFSLCLPFFFSPIPSPLLPWAKDINQGLPSPLLKLYLFVLITIYISHTQSSPPKRIYHLSTSTPDKICPLCLLSGPHKSPALKKIKGHDFFRWDFVGFQLYKSQNDEQSVCEMTFLNQRHNVPRSDRPLIFQFQLL